MKLGLKRIADLRETEGMTLIEILIAVAILASVLVGMAMMISIGFLQMNNMRVQRAAYNCSRMVIEYFETLPPDVMYGMSKNTPAWGNFVSGIQQLNDFVNAGINDTADTSCKELSDPSTPLGAKVALTYGICPGCFYATQLDSTGNPWTTCYYFLRLKVRYNSWNLGKGREIEYEKKYYDGASGSCDDTDNPNGCGAGMTENLPGEVKDCTW